MKVLAVALISSVLGGSAYAAGDAQASERHHYIQDVKAIVKANQKRIHRYEQSPPPGVKPNEAGTFETLVELDLYLLSREVHLYEHSFSTRRKVEAKLAQLSRDMEDAPLAHPDTARR